MSKGMIAILAVVILAFGGLVTWSMMGSQSVDYGAYDITRTVAADDANGEIGDHVKGNPDAKVIIVEWGDFSCSHCAASNPTFMKIARDYGDKIGWIHRNFPLGGYPNSLSVASAVEAAGWQGYYWEMAEAIFANQATWFNASESTRVDIYAEIFKRAVPDGDVDRMKSDMTDRRIAKKIDFDKNLGKIADIKGTPALFCDGELINGEIFGDETKFRQFINDKLVAAGEEPGPIVAE
jgi:protein-disulfide isomerase